MALSLSNAKPSCDTRGTIVRQMKVAAVGPGRDRVLHFEQTALGAAGAPRLFSGQVSAPRSPARRVACHETLSPRCHDGHRALVVVRILQVHALNACRARLERHEQIPAGVGARRIRRDHVPVAGVRARHQFVLGPPIGHGSLAPLRVGQGDRGRLFRTVYRQRKGGRCQGSEIRELGTDCQGRQAHKEGKGDGQFHAVRH